jgi:asparagine synthase (glutamine-hydrolysing)
MCGIAGIIDFDGAPIEPAELLVMNGAIAHRGPDDEGFVLIAPVHSRFVAYAGASSPAEVKAQFPLLTEGNGLPAATIGLSHRRFSIIDLSAAGHQPFFDKEGTCTVVFNGEIYNYVEIRAELAARGSRFYTQSDTEVLLEAYKCWGTDCFARLNGFWAIALYDFRRKELILSRDRIGKKPLYWTKAGARVYFASEIKALLQIAEVHKRRRVNEEAIFHWLVHGLKDLNFTTCFEGIHSLPSASWVMVDSTFPNRRGIFWKVPEDRLSEKETSRATAASTLRDLLQDSVRIRLRADVPVSVELSGGMDSSTLVALAAKASAQEIITYTVEFPDKEWNEEPFARSVAQHYKTDYRVLKPPLDKFWSQILAFTYLEEEPYHAPNLQTNQVIWSQMRSMGTKVSLNGAGGDENFAGYGNYFELAQVENLIHGRGHEFLRNSLRYSQANTGIKSFYKPFVRLLKEPLTRLAAYTGLEFMEHAIPSYVRDREYPRMSQPRVLSHALYSDMTNTLMPYWLRSGDRGYMGVPLEVRAPLLDFRVIDFAFRLPVTYLLHDGWHKWILRKAMEGLLPADVVWRRRKMGFPFPYARFYQENRDIIQLILRVSNNPYIDLTKFAFPQGETSAQKWKLLSFLLWYELFFNENMDLFKAIEAKARPLQTNSNYGFEEEFLRSCPMGVSQAAAK